MFYPTGPHQIYLQEKDGTQTIVRKALDWDGKIILTVLVTETGRFFVRNDDRVPGCVSEDLPSLHNRSVNINGGKLRCGALVYRTFVKKPPTLPLNRYQLRTKNEDALDFHVDNILQL